MNNTYQKWLVLAVALLTFFIVGCSGDDNTTSSNITSGAVVTDSSDTTPTTNTTVETPTFEGQKIVNLSDLPDPENLSDIKVGIIEYDENKGPITDRVVFDIRTDETIALKDTATGKADMFGSSVTAATFKSLPSADQAKLDAYVVPELSWSLLLNPIPNEAPYTWDVNGTTHFNPFAIREVRYAMNWLIDRKKMIDEISYGEGAAMFVPQTPGQPGTYQYNLIAAKLGMSDTGDEAYALQMISDAMEAAAALPENKGKLVKKNGFWTYNGSDVTIKFIIRVDDPSGRLLAGHYIADQVEKAGIKVERLEWDRSRSSNAVYQGNPANFEWQMYTEGWGAGATRRWWDITISQMYAPYYGYMPGSAVEGNWNYENEEIDTLAKKSYYGKFLTAEEYWEDNLYATELGLKESVRIYLNSLNSYFLVNNNRVEGRMLYGMADGLTNLTSLASADVKPNANGEKVFRVTQFSSQGSLFMGVWDPISTGGFRDSYSSLIVKPLSHRGSLEAPDSALMTEVSSDWYDIKSDVSADADGNLIGGIQVPSNALEFDPVTDTWVEVGEGVTAYSQGSAMYKYGRWHHGVRETLADILYAGAFIAEWATEDDDSDLAYEKAYASIFSNGLELSKGMVINDDGSITSYGDFNWPMEEGRVAANIASLSSAAGNSGRSTAFPWDLYEAASLLVTEGNTKGERYTIAQDASLKQLDIKSPGTVADIRAKYVELYHRGHVPASIKDYVTVEEAKERYAHGIKFIDTYGHAFISNGPYYMTKLDTANNFVELSAFRDAAYPFEKGYWNELFSTDMTRIDYIDIPAVARRGEGFDITAFVSQFTYPESAADDADENVSVQALIVAPNGTEYDLDSVYVGDGEFSIRVRASQLTKMEPGRYTVVVISSIGDEAPSTSTHTITLN